MREGGRERERRSKRVCKREGERVRVGWGGRKRLSEQRL